MNQKSEANIVSFRLKKMSWLKRKQITLAIISMNLRKKSYFEYVKRNEFSSKRNEFSRSFWSNVRSFLTDFFYLMKLLPQRTKKVL